MLKTNVPFLLVVSSILCSAGLLCQRPALAGDTKVLTEQAPTTDDRVIAPPLLNGAVRHDQADDPLSAGGAKTQPEQAQISDAPHSFKMSGKKFSSDDFRKMEFGILGLVFVKLPLAKHYMVVRVVPGCPAAEAGIKPGDLQISANGHVWTNKDTQKNYWHISDGKAGTPVDLGLMRKGEMLQFHLIRMNIEDVPNPSTRRMYERMLARFGPPTGEINVSTEAPAQ